MQAHFQRSKRRVLSSMEVLRPSTKTFRRFPVSLHPRMTPRTIFPAPRALAHREPARFHGFASPDARFS